MHYIIFFFIFHELVHSFQHLLVHFIEIGLILISSSILFPFRRSILVIDAAVFLLSLSLSYLELRPALVGIRLLHHFFLIEIVIIAHLISVLHNQYFAGLCVCLFFFTLQFKRSQMVLIEFLCLEVLHVNFTLPRKIMRVLTQNATILLHYVLPQVLFSLCLLNLILSRIYFLIAFIRIFNNNLHISLLLGR